MKYLVILFGAAIAMAGAAIAFSPRSLLSLLDRYREQPAIYVLAVVVRLLLGAVLIAYAPQSAFPLALRILGIVAIAAAIGILLMGPARLRRLIEWLLTRADSLARPAGVVAVVFGAFLVYAVA